MYRSVAGSFRCAVQAYQNSKAHPWAFAPTAKHFQAGSRGTKIKSRKSFKSNGVKGRGKRKWTLSFFGVCG